MGNLLYGIRAIIEAVHAGKEFERIFLQQGITNELMTELKRVLKQRSLVWQQVPVEKLNRLTTKNHQGAVAFISEIAYTSIETIVPGIFESGEVPLLLLADRITDVRNLGAMARSAVCSGVHALVIPSRGAAQISADAIKTSAGALHNINVCRENNLKDSIEFLKNSGLQLIACTEKASELIYDVNFRLPTAIIMGSEEDGISPEYLKLCSRKVKIPMAGNIASLNVSVATGIILFEAVRQRLKK